MNDLDLLNSLHPAPVPIDSSRAIRGYGLTASTYADFPSCAEYSDQCTGKTGKTGKKDSRCYTCKPRGKVLKHIINTSKSGRFVFNHDMHKRPVIILTSVKHYCSVNDLSPEELADLFGSIRDFMAFWKIKDYQISFNMGKWQGHDHFHCKLRLPDIVVSKMRKEHFQGLLED